MGAMIIPIKELEQDTLVAVVQAFVLREGTDYGDYEVSLDTKVEDVLAQLRCGEAVLLYSELHDSVDIVSRQEWQQRRQLDDAAAD